MKKVVSFSIFGSNEKYLIGMEKNIDICKEIYPDWKVYIYYNNTVPDRFLNSYKNNENVITIDMGEDIMPGMVWRFYVEDADLFISRDADSRITLREKLAVDEWIESGKRLHIMRDHPHHNFPILGGMWGMRIDKNFVIRENIKIYFDKKNKNLFDRMSDMDFLKDEIYFKYLNDSLIHDSFYSINEKSRPFPTKMENYHFVGEIFESDDTRNYQYEEWLNKKEK